MNLGSASSFFKAIYFSVALTLIAHTQLSFAGGLFDSIGKGLTDTINGAANQGNNKAQATSNNRCSKGSGISVGDTVSSGPDWAFAGVAAGKTIQEKDGFGGGGESFKLTNATEIANPHFEGKLKGISRIYVEDFPLPRFKKFYEGLSKVEQQKTDIYFEFKVNRIIDEWYAQPDACVLLATFSKFSPESEQAINEGIQKMAALDNAGTAKENARINSLVNAYRNTKIPADFLSSHITFNIGGEQKLLLVEYLDMCKKKPNIKTTLELSGNELVVKQKFIDKIKKTSTNVDILFSSQHVDFTNGTSRNVALVKRLLVDDEDSNAYEVPQVFATLIQACY